MAGISAVAAGVLITQLFTPPAMAASIEDLRLPGGPTSSQNESPVDLDVRLRLPDTLPAPAVVLAHGFGGSKDSTADEATFLVEQGFVVLTYSARGFGASTGLISMNAPDFEVADASALIDYLATRPEVDLDSAGDPRVGIAGGSYGGALALLAAGYDTRIDAVASDITWNDLEASLFAQSASGSSGVANPGVYKQMWSGLFFSAGLTTKDGKVTTCGRFTPEWCSAYTDAATTGTVSTTAAALMRRSSPISITDRITVPTLLGGGQSDSLFPLAQVNANAEQIMSAHPDVPVKVIWHAAGHDGGVNETERLRNLTAAWFSAHLANGPAVSNDFEVSRVEGSALSNRDGGTVTVLRQAKYPGLYGDSASQVNVLGPPQQVLAPAGGVPAAVTSLPGAGGLASLASGLLNLPLPNQSASFASEPLAQAQQITGSTRVRLTVAADRPVTNVTLFASLRVVSPQGRPTLPNGLVAPIRLSSVGPTPTQIEVDLPTIVTEVAAGDRIAVVIVTTDQAYRLPDGPAVYTVSLTEPGLMVPVVTTTADAAGIPAWAWPIGGIAVALLAWLVIALLRPRHHSANAPSLAADADPSGNVPPVVVSDLVKEFPDGVRAVDGVSFTVPAGVVLGLLGPNGAGKSTTMRMIMGLIQPTAGQATVFGEPVYPGAPSLARIGCFVEGPGLLPHLTGRQNLDLFWRASGRTGDAHLDEVLEVAGLGSAIDRRVRTYSQGMRQRVGIAQAMLGLPDLLLLDEPTNGLDPPQIKEMRQVVQDYARDGRTVIISSHLLSEVEQSCSHVVVMNRGRVIAEGTVVELLAGHGGRRLEDVFLEMVGEGHEVVTS